jgi:hypothetical protein
MRGTTTIINDQFNSTYSVSENLRRCIRNNYLAQFRYQPQGLHVGATNLFSHSHNHGEGTHTRTPASVPVQSRRLTFISDHVVGQAWHISENRQQCRREPSGKNMTGFPKMD